MYELNSVLIAAILLAAMTLALFTGWRLGIGRARTTGDDEKTQILAVQGSLLGLLALLLGFSISLSLARFDARSAAVVEEANAIGTAWLRTDLLPEGVRDEAKALMREYVAARIDGAAISAADTAGRGAKVAEAEAAFAMLWAAVAGHVAEARNPVAMAVAASLNDMIDALAARNAVIERHVPEVVLLTLSGVFVLLGAMVGYASALTGRRPGVPVYTMMTIIVFLVFVIIDLDRPRRGLIEVDQSPLLAAGAGLGL